MSKQESNEVIEIYGVSEQDAKKRLRRKISGHLTIFSFEVVHAPLERTLDVSSKNEVLARIAADNQLVEQEKLVEVVLKKQGKQGFLGIRNTPSIFTARVVKPGLYRFFYKTTGQTTHCKFYKKFDYSESHYCDLPRPAGTLIVPEFWGDLCTKRRGKGCIEKAKWKYF
jgi:hypothetical protein